MAPNVPSGCYYDWLTWNQTYYTSGTATNIMIPVTWNSWNSASTTSIISQQSWMRWTTIVETKEQTRNRLAVQKGAEEKWLRDQAEHQKRLAEQLKVQNAAKQRARKLLVDHLSKDQRDSYEKQGFFYLYTKDKCYRIDQGTHGNVKLIEQKTKKVIGSYCIQPNDVPAEDAMLAQKLYIEMCEEEFIKRANFNRWAA